MKEDQLQQKITDGLTKAIVGIAAAITFFILYSASAATDLFFRRKFGERYFTVFRAWLGGAGWAVAIGIGLRYKYDFDPSTMQFNAPKWVLILTWAVGFLYVMTAHYRLREIRMRINAGEVWHSRSRGESIFGSENIYRDTGIDLVVTIVLLVILPSMAAFYVLSRFLGYAAEALAAQQFYNKFLDIRDAQIEAENMESVLRHGAAGRASGYRCSLPGYIQGTAKANVVRVLVPGANVPIVGDEARRTQKARSGMGWLAWGFHFLRTAGGGSRTYFYLCVLPSILYAIFTTISFSWKECAKMGKAWHEHRVKSIAAAAASTTYAPTGYHQAAPGYNAPFQANTSPTSTTPPAAPPANEVDSSNQQPASQVDVQQQLAQQKLLQQKRLAEAQAQAKAEAQAKILQAQVDTLVSDYNTQRTLVKEFFVQAQADLIENTNLIIANRIFTRSKYLNENDQFFQQLSVLAKEQVKIYQAAKAAIDEFKATPGASYQDYKTRLDTIYSDLKKKRDAFAEQLADFRKRILK